MKRHGTALILLLLASPLAHAQHEGEEYTSKSVLFRAAATGKARTFVTAAYVAGLTDALRDEGPFTVFVPTDQAFANLPEKDVVALLQPDKQKVLADLLKYHVIKGKVLAAEITNDPRPTTLAGPKLTIAANGHGVAVNEATIVQTDLIGRNGVVHLIDRVLTPPAGDVVALAERDGNFKLLLAAVEAAGLTETLKKADHVTILAPNDAAFARLGEKTLKALLKDKDRLKQILLYHVIGESLTARQLVERGSISTLLGTEVNIRTKDGRPNVAQGNVPFLTRDLEASNGYIQVIESVLTPPGDDVVSVARKAGNFKLLLASLEATGLDEALRGLESVTILAPTDEAFAALGEKNIKALLADKERLAGILKYHVILGRHDAETLLKRGTWKTLQGENVTLKIKGGRLKVAEGDVSLVDTDIPAENGVIHVIDAVLMPSGGHH